MGKNTKVKITFTIPDTDLQPDRPKIVQHFIDEIRKKLNLFDDYKWEQKEIRKRK
jgi:hypothetical protein